MTSPSARAGALLGRSSGVVGWIAAAALVPFVFGHDLHKMGQYNFIIVLVMVGIGLNIVLGYAGVLFLGPSALLAAGAYAAAVMATHYQPFQNLPLMCLTSVVVAEVIAVVVALATLRVGGFYLGMVTLFLALVVPLVAEHWSLTGGDSGILLQLDPTFVQRPTGTDLYLVGVAIVAALTGLAWLIKSSRLGRRFGTIMASEELAQSVGVTPYRTKFVAFALAAVPCGLAGGYYVFSEQFISSQSITVQESIYIVAGVVIGGSGTIMGPILGVALIGIGGQFLGSFNQYEGIIYGGLLVLVALLMPQGMVGLYTDTVRRIRGRAPTDRFTQRVARQVATDSGTKNGTAGGTDSNMALASAPADDGAALIVRNVSRRFGGVLALDGVDLELRRGQIHALVGPNGSGKTTLLNLITGYYSLHGGTIELGDTRLDRLGSAAIPRHGVVRTFQTPKLKSTDDCLRNVMIAADQHSKSSLAASVLHTPGSRRAEYESGRRAAAALAAVGLLDRSADTAALIPHGLQRLLEIARAIALEPRFVLLDEPAAGLSGAESEVLKDVVRKMAAAGYGVLIVEHNLPVVFDVADTVTVLDQGHVIASGTPQDVIDNPEVVRVYIGRQQFADRVDAEDVAP